MKPYDDEIPRQRGSEGFQRTQQGDYELLAKYIDTPKKSMTALEESELDLIFEHYTQKYQTENFDAYYATAKEKKEEPAPAASEAAGHRRPGEIHRPDAG